MLYLRNKFYIELRPFIRFSSIQMIYKVNISVKVLFSEEREVTEADLLTISRYIYVSMSTIHFCSATFP